MNKLKSKLQTRSNSLFVSKLTSKDESKSRLSADSNQIIIEKSRKSYFKPQCQSNKKPFTQTTNNQYEKKTCKLINTKKPSLSIHRYSHRKTFEKTEASSNVQMANNSIKNMIYILQNSFIVSRKKSSNFTIKTQDLKKLLQSVLLFKVDCLQDRLLKDNQQFTDCLVGVWKAIQSQISKKKAQALNYFSKVSIQVTRDDYEYEWKERKQKIWELETLRVQKEAALSDLNQSLRDSYSHKQAINLTINNKQAQLADLQRKCDHQERILFRLEAQIAKKQQFLRNLQERQSAIFNFVNNQNKSQMVKLASEQYKQIQSDLYEYAVYLQANQLASSLTYEHLPIVCHTHKLQEELNALCKDLLHNEQLTLNEKCLKMNKFVLQVHQRYRKQGIEIKKMMDFKTKQIIKYVEKMKMWLNNWELKQEYLKNLRIQYLLTHDNLMNMLTNSKRQKFCEACWQFNPEQRQKVIELFLKLNENFQMGNSFY